MAALRAPCPPISSIFLLGVKCRHLLLVHPLYQVNIVTPSVLGLDITLKRPFMSCCALTQHLAALAVQTVYAVPVLKLLHCTLVPVGQAWCPTHYCA